MFRALATAVNSERFTDGSEFINQQTKLFSNPYANISKNPILNSRSILGSVDPTTRQLTLRDAQLLDYATNVTIPQSLLDAQQVCITQPLESLLNNQSTRNVSRCGWIYKKGITGSQPEISTGFLGESNGPYTFFSKKPPEGSWFWNLDDAKKAIMKDRCAALTSCANVGAENYKGCAFSKISGSGVPVDLKGNLLYPDDPTASAPPSSLILTSDKCPPPPSPGSPSYELARSRDICMPMENGHLSRDCMLQQITAAGCKQDGSLYTYLINQATPNNYADGLQNTTGYKKYQQLSQNPLLDSVVRTGNTSVALALGNFQQVLKQSAATTKDELTIAARDLCLQKGLMDTYDFCNDLTEFSLGPFALNCLQKAWLKAGGHSYGTQFPSQSNKASYDQKFRTWGEYKTQLQTYAINCKSSNESIQTNALQSFLGIQREKKSTNQIPSIQGVEVFWFNSSTNGFIGRRLTLVNPKIPKFNTSGHIENTALNVNVEYYMLTNLRPSSKQTIRLSLTTDDGMIYAINTSIDGQKTRGQAFNDTSMLGANWDQAPTQYIAKQCWTLEANGPNYFTGYWQQTGGGSTSLIQYLPCNGGSWNEIPSDWMTLTQEPNAPMLSWEGTDQGFIERRFPSMMEFVIKGGSVVANPSSTLKYPTVLKLRASGNGGMGQTKRNISRNSWRTLTCSFLVNSANNGFIVGYGNALGFSQIGTSVRVTYNSATLTVDTTFDNVLVADGSTPHYIMANMRSTTDSKYPNLLSVYVGKFGPVDEFSIRKFTTVQGAPLYNSNDSDIIGSGYGSYGVPDVSIGSIRLFDYELKAEQFAIDQANTWKMKYIV